MRYNFEKIKNIEDSLSEFFNVSIEDLYSNNKKRKESNARHYLWFMLHNHCGMSNGEIAKRFNRTKRKVIYYISEVKFRVANQNDDRLVYQELKEKVLDL